jgi:hypothetical protein
MKMDTTTIILIALGGYLFYEYIWPNLSSSSSTTTTPTTTPNTTTKTPVTTPISTTTVNTPVSNTPTSGTNPPVTTSVNQLPAVGAGGGISVNNTMTPPTNLNCKPGYAPQSVYGSWQCTQVAGAGAAAAIDQAATQPVSTSVQVAGAGAAAAIDQAATSVQAAGAGAAAAIDQAGVTQATTDIAALTALAASNNGGIVPNTLTFSDWNWLYLMLYPSGGKILPTGSTPSTTMMTLNQFLGLPGKSSVAGIGLLNLTNSRMGTPMMTRLAGLGMRRNVGMWGIS